MAHLERISLSGQVAAAISAEISAGVWLDRLPGYRLLGERYQVSRPTCEAAFRILEASGVIGAAESGKTRRILLKSTAKSPARERHLLIVIDARHPLSPQAAELIGKIEHFWRLEGGMVSRVESDLGLRKRPEFLLKRWVATFGADCLLFQSMYPAWAGAVRAVGLPCHALGGALRHNLDVLSGSGLSVSLFLRDFLRKALELGHRRILFVTSRAHDMPQLESAVLEAVGPMFDEDWSGGRPGLSIQMPDLINPTDWRDWWWKIIRQESPELVIVDSVFPAIALHDLCLGCGIEMPRDLSMVVMEDSSFFEWMTPSPTRYRYAGEIALRHFRDWVNGGFPLGSLKVFGAEFSGGKTLGPPPKRDSGGMAAR